MAATDARPVPRRAVACRVYFAILDNTGAPVPSASGLDSEISIDGAAVGDCTNEATYISGSAGAYYLDLTSAEMDGDGLVIEVKTSTINAKTTQIFLYPASAGDLDVNLDAAVSTRSTYAGGAVASVAAPVTVTGTPDVNVAKVAGTTVQGTGTANDPWGPV